ncbi:hypothetical protein APS56_07705 [Pseudalgibacter alginicilyticus]|uniref:Orotate phosphoribosyltransferase n=1 Tax=Pseudalgibacter alginicilyticus TaxID=1736674 RepID=A0A0P0CQ50_9FLAO|nr:DUF4870 domain-containing protein [Pseudalgibacter alginicilyticus]ALJ05015.1 hypothetical protein APS56_07705 [Pseudalgibacter alginicilyticus]
MPNNHQKNIATFIHLSIFSKFIIPFGNFIGPVVLWAANKDKSEYINNHGKQAINFQISILLYTLIIGLLTLPFFLYNLFPISNFLNFNEVVNFEMNVHKLNSLFLMAGGLAILALLGFILEFILIIIASLKARDGQLYKYPFTINFLK